MVILTAPSRMDSKPHNANRFATIYSHMIPAKSLLVILFLTLPLGSGGLLSAADKTWTGSTSGIWNTAGNWSPSGVPTASDNAIFNSSGATNLTVDTSNNVTISTLAFNSNASSNITINANNNFRLEGILVDSGSTGSHTLSAVAGNLNIGTNNVANGSYDYHFTNNSAKLFTVKSTSSSYSWSSANQTSGTVVRNWIFDGSGDMLIDTAMSMTNASMSFQTINLLKSGAGTLTLNGTSNNYNGVTNITGGVLAVAKLDNGGSTSSIGVSSSNAANLIINGGTLRYVGATNSSTDRLFTMGVGSNGATLDASGTGALSLTGTGTVAFTAANTASTLTLAGTGTGSNSLGANIILADNGSGALSVVKNGAGTWLISGTQNTYSGGTSLNAGVLLAGNNSALGTGTLTFNGGTLSANGASSRTFSNNVLFSGLGGFGQSGITGSVILNGNINLGGTVRTIVTEGGGANFNATSGTVSNGGILKSGTGALVLSGSNDYAAGTWLSDGTLLVGTSTSLGSGTLTISGGTLASAKTTAITLANNLLITGNFTLGATALGGTGQLTLAGTVDLGGGVRNVSVENASQRINGSIVNGGLVKMGTGILQINGNSNTYAGGTTVKEGTLLLSKSNALPTTGAVTVEGGLLDLGGFDASTGVMTFKGGSVANGIVTATSYSGQSGTVSAVLAGTGSMTKTTSGTLILEGANTYTGTTGVNAGTLIINGSISNSSATVNSGGRIAGNGTTGNLTIASGGELTPGVGIGILTASGAFDLQNGATLIMELTGSGTTAGVNYDQLQVSGNILLGGTLTLSLSSFSSPEGSRFFLINNTGSSAITGTFAGLAQDSTFSQGGVLFRISYTANIVSGEFTGGNDVALEVVPEVASWQLICEVAGIWALVRIFRRRRKSAYHAPASVS